MTDGTIFYHSFTVAAASYSPATLPEGNAVMHLPAELLV